MTAIKAKDFDIESLVTIHDAYQFEVKLEYNLEELEKTNNYKIETFFFIPRSLQINSNTYRKEEFYTDLQNYIRFKTPSYSFKLILDPEFESSPFFVLRKIYKELMNEKDAKKRQKLVRRCVKELKLLGIMYRARMIDFEYFIKEKVNTIDEDPHYLLIGVEEMVVRGIKILQELRTVRKDFADSFCDEKELAKYFQTVEEFLSNILEEEMIGIIRLMSDQFPSNQDLKRITSEFEDFCRKESQRRKAEGFQLVLKKDERFKEQYIYFMSQYKKVLASILFLDILREHKRSPYVQALNAAAAFSASVLYFAIMFLISQNVAINSIPFLLFLSVGYIFKDRLKDDMKTILNPKVLSKFPDHITQIKDISEEGSINLGNIREKVFFTDRSYLEQAILEFRDKTRPAMLLAEESHEDIMVYQKEIIISTETIGKNHSRTVDITDIMRFNIHRYLEKMDDPKQEINYYDEENGTLASTTGQRTYHLNMVIKYSELQHKNGHVRYERYRIVLNKKGIVRVEFVDESLK